MTRKNFLKLGVLFVPVLNFLPQLQANPYHKCEMTNFDRWQLLLKNCTSPQLWIDFGYYYLIAAALQRRVWFNSEEPDTDKGALFVNPYYCFIGPPGVGKGAVTRQIAGMLRCHRYEKGVLIKTSTGAEKPLLFPVGADSVTFEQLLASMAVSIRRVPLPKGSYNHCSYAFVLEELSSLFKTKTADVSTFLLNAYDCVPYDYETKHQGVFRLRNPCLAFIAGTTPDFIYNSRKTGLFGQGFASRALLLFDTRRRFSRFHTTILEPEQVIAREQLNLWIVRLANAYGRLTYNAETHEFLEHWETTINAIDEQKCPPRMQEYFARKKVTMLKLAAALHFSENLSYEISLDTFKHSIGILNAYESKLEVGLGGVGRNPIHGFIQKLYDYSKQHGGVIPENEFILKFGVDMEMREIREALETLVAAGSIKECLMQNNKKGYKAA